MSRFPALLGGVVALFAALASAQAEVISLETAIAHTLQQQPALRAAHQSTLEAQARHRVAKGAFLPTLEARYSALQSNNPLDSFAQKLNTRSVDPAIDFTAEALNEPDTTTLYGTELNLNIPLYTGGALHAGVGGARASSRAASLGEARQKQLWAFRTRVAYFSAQTAKQGALIADDAVAAARAHAKDTRLLHKQGRIVISDTLTASVYLNTMQVAREQAQAQWQLAINALRNTTASQDPALDVMPWAPQTLKNNKLVLTELEQKALQQRADLRALKHLQTAAQAGVKVAQSKFHPRLGVQASSLWYGDDPNTDEQSWRVMGVLSMNLFNGGRDKQTMHARQNRVNARQAQQDALKLQIKYEVRDALATISTAARRITLTRNSLADAGLTVALVNKRYGQGRTILIDLLQAERTLIQARQSVLGAELDYEKGMAALALALGGEITIK
ncbi:MAG: TolC family outer membrane protein [Gammaproteobacteria bacterium]|nr:MAG: TolC family outer membrane protein [Gammaproteobacteria bacterium]